MDNFISKKKEQYPVITQLRNYLIKYKRAKELPVSYQDLLAFDSAIPVYDSNGEDTLWLTVLYDQGRMEEIHTGLKKIYSIIKSDGTMELTKHLSVDRVDFCTFGNSKPFRIRIINKYNDNYDYYYIKIADASRVYGLELEHLLAPNRIQYLVYENTLIEEHIAGIPGDMFLKDYMNHKGINRTRLAKEFIKFNERCFVKLLGDMRAYNFVIDITQDFDDIQYRVRAIDFDQQCYEGKVNLYLSQFFKENLPYVKMCTSLINITTAEQYQQEERALMNKRLNNDYERIDELLKCMEEDVISKKEKVSTLAAELAVYYKNPLFLKCTNMGNIVRLSLDIILKKNQLNF